MALERSPRSAPPRHALGLSLVRQKRLPEALRVLKAALDRSPYDRDLLIALVSYQLAAGNAAAARQHVALLRELEPGNPEIERMARGLSGAPG